MQNCAHFVLKATTLQPIQAYSSQTSEGDKTLAGVGWNELELVAVG